MCVLGFGVAAAAAISLSVHLDLKGAHRENFHFYVFMYSSYVIPSFLISISTRCYFIFLGGAILGSG